MQNLQSNNRNRRLNRSVSPLSEKPQMSHLNVSPDCFSKFTSKDNGECSQINGEHYGKPSRHTKQFLESPISTDYAGGLSMKKREDQYWTYSLSEVNLELDNNMNELIFLLGKRKNLLSIKKRKVRDDLDAKLLESKNISSLQDFSYASDKQFLNIVDFCKSTETAVNILSKLTKILPNVSDPSQEQKQKSEIFWERNRILENDIDRLLENLKSTDRNLENQNSEIHEICKELDRIEGHLKSFVGAKSSENIQRVEPLFDAKKKKYDVLNKKVKSREQCKDTKIDFIKTIRKVLEELLKIREKRLKEIAHFFGLQNMNDFSELEFKDQENFSESFEELIKIKEKDSYLQEEEREVFSQIQYLEREQDKLYNQILKKQSDEAKAYHAYHDIASQRTKYSAIMSLFGAERTGTSIFDMDPKDLTHKFKECKGVIKMFLEEESSLRQGLIKTMETSRTFANLLSATENEKERRYELLSLLETCIHRRGEYELKKEELRKLAFEESRVQQELTEYQDELQTVLTDGDIDNYKQIGNAIGHCEKQKSRFKSVREKLEREMERMDEEVVAMANKVNQEYEDILCNIVPSDYQYSLKNGEDVKKLRNHLRKTYKRLGILSVNHDSN